MRESKERAQRLAKGTELLAMKAEIERRWANASLDERRYWALREIVYDALEHAYDALGALQDCCPEDTDFFRNALTLFGELIDEINDKL